MGGDVPRFDVMGGVLRRVTDVIGPGAAYSMFHYAASQEGRRLASDSTRLEQALGRIDEALGTHTQVIEDAGARLVLRVQPGNLAAFTDRAVQGLVLGLLEGAVAATRPRPMPLRPLAQGHGNGGPLDVEFGGVA